MVIVLLTGFIAGLIHVLSGPDHLAAIAPLAAKAPTRAWGNGIRWGTGHASGVLFVGVLSLCLRGLLPIDLISSWSERLVGVMLIGIALWGFRAALRIHAHEHGHDGEQHEHIHMHAPGKTHTPSHHVHTHAAFGIGTLHGLAGSSHFLAILPSLAMPTKTQAIIYLVAYGVGTVLAMGIFALSMGKVADRLTDKVAAYRKLMWGCSTAALAVGAFWLFS
ncbi:MAG: High-affinity nickel transporter [Limisphaerales bacterium]